MDVEDAKDLERYIRDKRRAEAKNKLSEMAQLCNCIGEIYSKYGRHDDAIQEHTQERHLSEALGDKIGEAIACRKIGESLCAMGQYKEALEMQKKHLTIARDCENHLEEQRAWATIGRTYLSQAESRNIQESLAASKKAEKAFVKALEACEKVKSSVKLTEYMAMKGRIYLNLGLVFDIRGDMKQSADVMKRAVTIAEKFKLDDELHMCHSSLANMYQKGGQYSQALRSLEVALKVAEKLRNKVWEREVYVSKATVHVSTGDFIAAKHCLKKAHKLKIDSDISEKKLVKMFRCVNKMQEATVDLETESDEKKFVKLYEVIADCHAELGNYTEAIESYLKVIQYSSLMSSDERAAIYVSLARTYADIRQYDSAICYYNQELEERKDNPEQSCRTLLNIAELEELKGSTYATVCKIYMSAFENAKKAKHPKLQVQTLKSLILLQRLFKQTTHLVETEKKLASTLKKYNVQEDSDSQNEEDDNSSEDSERAAEEEDDKGSDQDGNISLSDLTVSDESDCEPDNFGGETSLIGRKKKSKLARRNEKGETPLHRACIDGNLKKVKSLIAEGHPVNPRDYCGWLPLHEASNHGYVSVVEFLLDSGAWINDRGGERCGGITPLIDAANCGNLDVVRLLVERGANVMAKDDDGNTALDSLQAWHNRTGDVIGGSDEMAYMSVRKLLQNKMGRGQTDCPPSQSRETRPLVPASTVTGGAKASAVSAKGKSLRLPDLSDSDDGDDNKDTNSSYKQSAHSFRERLTKLRQKKENKQPGRSTKRSSKNDKEDCLSSDEGSWDSDNIYHQLRLSPPIPDSRNPGVAAQVYQSAIDFIGSSAQRRLEGDTHSGNKDDSDSDRSQPVSALVNANEDVGDDWLINDMQAPKTKKKSAAVHDILTTNSSRPKTGTRKRNHPEDLKSRASSKFSGLLEKRNKLSRTTNNTLATGSRNPSVNEKQRIREQNDGSSSDEACPVSSSTETTNVANRSNTLTTDRGSEYTWDSDDDMLCQIDTVYDGSGQDTSTDFGRSSQNPSQRNRSFNSSVITPSPVLHGREHIVSATPVGNVDSRFGSISEINKENNKSAQHSGIMHSKSNDFLPVQAGNTQCIARPQLSPSHQIVPVEKPTYKNSMRVKVKVGDHTLLIPIQPADQDNSIQWLVLQARERYFNMFLIRPTLTLSTQDGTILCPSDNISTVLQDSELLTANVSAWERPKLEDRYVRSCKLCLSDVNKNVSSALQQCDLSGHLQLSDMGLGFSSLQPVFQSLDGQKTLVELRLNGNRLGDSGMDSLTKLVTGLPVLKVLTLDTNGISAEGIQCLALALKSELCLQSLTTLSLSHNCLDDIAADSLAIVISSLPELSSLNLASCNFSPKLFTTHFCDALRGRRLVQVNMAENQIREEGIKSLLLSLHPDCLLNLDVSHTRSASDQDIVQCLQDFLSCDRCSLRELSLAGCHLSEADVTFINRLPIVAKSLRSLSISQNQKVNNKSLQKLLYLCADGGSELEELTARGCSVTSPLDSELAEAMKRKMSCCVPLKKFVLSCRGLRETDRQIMQDIWMRRWKDKGQVKTVGMAMSLTVL